jgi:hypothetical protein
MRLQNEGQTLRQLRRSDVNASNTVPTRSHGKGALIVAILSVAMILVLATMEVVGVTYYNWSTPSIVVVLGIAALAYGAVESFKKWKAARI